MSAHMAIAAATVDLGSDRCHGCDGADDVSADPVSCVSLCASAAHGLVPGESADLLSASRTAFQIAHVLGNGHVSSPEHGPPKLLAFG